MQDIVRYGVTFFDILEEVNKRENNRRDVVESEVLYRSRKVMMQ